MIDIAGLDIQYLDEWNEFVDVVRSKVIDDTPLVIKINQRGIDRSKSVVCVQCGKTRYGIKTWCKECGSLEVGFRVREKDKSILSNPEESLQRTWFHATDNPDWMECVTEAEVTVHIGSYEAALSAAIERSLCESSYVFELKLLDTTSIAPWVCPDVVNLWNEEVDEFTENLEHDFINYVNLYESPGSISMIGDPKKLVIIGMTKVVPLEEFRNLTWGK